MNQNQFDIFSTWLSNLSVGILLVGVCGPQLIQTELRYELLATTIVSLVMGLGGFALALYSRRG